MPTLEITTKIGCRLACSFCPQDAFIKNYPRNDERMLSFENLKLALTTVPKYVRIDFSGMTEPWLNPGATEMVDYAYALGYPVAIYTTLEGMSPDDASYLLQKYHSKIRPYTPWVIHLPDDEQNMRGWTSSENYLKTLSTIIEYKDKFNIESLTFMTMSAAGSIAPDLKSFFKSRFDSFVGITRAENLNRENFDERQLTKKIINKSPLVCKSTPFFDHNGMLPNGDIVLCCMDYSLQNCIGNLFIDSYKDLFLSKKMGEIRAKAMSFGDDFDFICRSCENAACLNQNSEGDWVLDSEVFWSTRPIKNF